MKKTFREKFRSRCLRAMKKYKWAHGFIMAYMIVILAFYYFGLFAAQNAKRFSCALALLLCSILISSFALPVEPVPEEITEIDENGLLLSSEEEPDLQVIEDITIEELEILDDVEFMGDEEMEIYTLDEILDSYKQDDTETPRTERDTEADYSDYVFDPEDWRLILVNKQHPIPDGYEVPLGTITGTLQCDERILEDLLDMLKACRDDGVNIEICSPYRDFNRQTYLFERKIVKYMDAGMTYMDAYKKAGIAVTAPNASEHVVGLSLDLYCSSYHKLDEGFAKTETGKWLAEHCYEYGFILRYPSGKEYITGIEFEPWHFRYVGVEAATVITQNGLCLEEFWEEYF